MKPLIFFVPSVLFFPLCFGAFGWSGLVALGGCLEACGIPQKVGIIGNLSSIL